MRKSLAIVLIAFSLAMITSAFLVKRVHNFLHPQREEEEIKEPFSPFGFIKQINNTQQKEEESEETMEIHFEEEEPLQKEKEIVKPVIQIELTAEEKQAVENYSKNPKVQSFVQELSGVISKEEMEKGNYLQIAFKPEVRSIFMKYAQDKEFRDLATQIMKDKDLLKLTNDIIKQKEVQK